MIILTLLKSRTLLKESRNTQYYTLTDILSSFVLQLSCIRFHLYVKLSPVYHSSSQSLKVLNFRPFSIQFQVVLKLVALISLGHRVTIFLSEKIVSLYHQSFSGRLLLSKKFYRKIILDQTYNFRSSFWNGK